MLDRKIRAISLAISLVALLSLGAIGRAETTYTLQNIGVLGQDVNGHGLTSAWGISNTGIVAASGNHYDAGGTYLGSRFAVWVNGTLTDYDLGTDSAGNTSGGVNGISPGGLVIGDSNKYVGGTLVGNRGVVWQNGVLTEVGTLGTSGSGSGFSSTVAVNSANVVIGNSTKYASGSNVGRRGFVWQSGVMTDIGTLGTSSFGDGWSYVNAINAAGVVAGNSDYYDVSHNFLGSRAAKWAGGTLTGLSTLGTAADDSAYSDTSGLNASGQIVGYSEVYTAGHTYQGLHAALWQPNGSVTDLGSLGSNSQGRGNSNAIAINDAGVIMGNSEKYLSGGVDKGLRGVVWQGGQTFEMGTLGADSNGVSYSNVWAMNAVGDVVGTTKKYDNTGALLGSRATFVHDGITTFIDPQGDSTGFGFSRPSILTDDDIVYGDYYKFSGDTLLGDYAFMWTPTGGLVDLDSLVPGGVAAAGWDHLEYVSGINSLGQIVGYGVRLNGEQQGFILTPIPEPTALVIFLAPIVLRVGKRPRKF